MIWRVLHFKIFVKNILRLALIRKNPSFFKFEQYFSNDNFKSIHKLCQYLVKATHRREQLIVDVIDDVKLQISIPNVLF